MQPGSNAVSKFRSGAADLRMTGQQLISPFEGERESKRVINAPAVKPIFENGNQVLLGRTRPDDPNQRASQQPEP